MKVTTSQSWAKRFLHMWNSSHRLSSGHRWGGSGLAGFWLLSSQVHGFVIRPLEVGECLQFGRQNWVDFVFRSSQVGGFLYFGPCECISANPSVRGPS